MKTKIILASALAFISFQDRKEAAQWLGVPIERLAIPTAGDKTS
jgi:hypothetical protein